MQGKMAEPVSVVSLLLLFSLLTVAVFTELKDGRIPNWLTYAGMGAGMLIGWFDSREVFYSHVLGLIFGFGFLFIFWMYDGVAGGDVKLMGAAGALLGSNLIKPALLYTSMVGALLAIAILIWRKDFWTRLTDGINRLACFWRKKPVVDGTPLPPVYVPYGIAIALGCLMAVLIAGG